MIESASAITYKNNEQIDAEVEANRRQAEEQNSPVVLGLASYVRRCWRSARDAKRSIEKEMHNALLQRKGEYTPEKLQAIKEHGGSEIFMGLTEEKCVACEAWINDIVLSQQEKPWRVKPTPVPDIPQDFKQRIRIELFNRLMGDVTMGVIGQEQFNESAENIEEDMLQHAREQAKKELQHLENEIEDDLVEGGFYQVLKECLYDLTTYPNMFIKSPVVRLRKKLVWGYDESTGQEGLVLDDVVSIESERVSPQMIFPSPSSTEIGDSYIFEVHQLLRSELFNLIGVGGFKEDAIRQVLREHRNGSNCSWLTDTENISTENNADKEYSDSDPDKKIDALQFWGSVSGHNLLEYGMSVDEIPDADNDYPVEVWLIDNVVIKAQINPDKLGRPPYFTTSFRKVPGSFWGRSLCMVLRDIQDQCNAAARNLINNMGIASGPQVAVDIKAMPPGEDITKMYSWKIWQFEDLRNKPLEFFQPQSMARELWEIYKAFSNEADTKSGIPQYTSGAGSAGGALSTATGFSMMFNNASRGIKNVVSNIDDVIEGVVKRHYQWRCVYMPFDGYFGDARIVAEGSSSLIAKEQQQVRRQELLQIMLNPAIIALIGADGLIELLRGVVDGADLKTDDIIPSKEEMARINKMQEMAFNAATAAQGNQPQPQAPAQVNGGGQLVSGQEYKTV